jgi:heme/copper-type cytochrome/quinol oxidase subunit 3
MSSSSQQTAPKKTNVMIPDHVFGALVFVFVEVMFYSALISSFFVMRKGRDSWGMEDARALPVLAEGFNGLVLGLGFLSILLALRAFQSGRKEAHGHLFRAFGLSALFSLYQVVLAWKLVGVGVTLTSSVFGGCLYLIFGSHVLQTIIGSAWIGKIFLSSRGNATAFLGELRGLTVFWGFLFAIWPVIYVELFF